MKLSAISVIKLSSTYNDFQRMQNRGKHIIDLPLSLIVLKHYYNGWLVHQSNRLTGMMVSVVMKDECEEEEEGEDERGEGEDIGRGRREVDERKEEDKDTLVEVDDVSSSEEEDIKMVAAFRFARDLCCARRSCSARRDLSAGEVLQPA